MSPSSFADRAALELHQLSRLNALLTGLGTNPFWAPRVEAAGVAGGVASLDEFRERMPLLDKQELAADQVATPPYGTNLTQPLERYVRVHQTSSTTGAPLRWLDTAADWEHMLERWVEVLAAAELTANDRFLVAFSFGPFVGFWLAFEAAQRMGCLVIPGGALDSQQRLQVMATNEVTVLGCTPTYALRLGEVARAEGLRIDSLRAIVVGGEPGASLPALRARMAELWPAATLFDHHGMTEVGPVTFQSAQPGLLHVMESGFLTEIIDPESGAPLPPDSEELGELVLTTLERPGRPVLRYRTRDLVSPAGFGPAPRPYLRLAGGIRARTDQMVVVRGVNVYPTAVDELVRGVGGVAEYRVEIDRRAALAELRLVAEPSAGSAPDAVCASLERAFREAWNLRVPVTAAAPGELPRFELKAQRWVERMP